MPGSTFNENKWLFDASTVCLITVILYSFVIPLSEVTTIFITFSPTISELMLLLTEAVDVLTSVSTCKVPFVTS